MTTQLVSKSNEGIIGNARSLVSHVSNDGRFVIFSSDASNLVPDDTNNLPDVFIYDRQTDTIERMILPHGSTFVSAISSDNRYVLVESNFPVTGESGANRHIFLYDRETNVYQRVDNTPSGGEPNDDASLGSFSGNDRYITYSSTANDIVAGDTNRFQDVFVFDRVTGVTERVSLATDGTQPNQTSAALSISGDGRYVSFQSSAKNLLLPSSAAFGQFVYDRETDTLRRVDVGPTGAPGELGGSGSSLSDDGRYVAFSSPAMSLAPGETVPNPHVYVLDLQTNQLERVDPLALGVTSSPSPSALHTRLSGDGRFVVYTTNQSYDPSDINGKADIYVYDRLVRSTTLISRGPDGSIGDNDSSHPSISPDGRFISFNSLANNWVAGDGATADFDIFVVDRAVASASIGDDFLYGTPNVDFIAGLGGNDSIYGGDGGDGLHGEAGNDAIYGGNGDDVGVGLSGNDFLFGGAGNDTLIGDDGADTLTGGAGVDQLFGYADSDTLNGEADGDFLSGGDGNDTLYGDGGDDAIHGEGGDDIGYGGTGHDVLVGYDGNDTLNGDDGNDTIIGHAGDDVMNGDAGNDQVFGYEGADLGNGGAGDDFIAGGAGDDTLHGDDGGDVLDGEGDDDQLFGDDGGDNLNGNLGNDTLFGGAGNDGLLGHEGNDILDGGAGNDFLIGGVAGGNGALGNDTFVFHNGTGNDNIADFNAGAGTGDVIDIRDFGFANFAALLAAATDLASGVYVQLDADDAIFLEGLTKALLAPDDFLLA